MSDSALSSSPEDRRNRGYLDAFCIWLCVVLISLAINWARWIGRHIAIGIKEILIAELTSKVIKSHGKSGLEQMKNTVNSEARPMAADDGKIINMLTSDAERVFVLFAYIDELYCLPFILGIGVWYMYRLLGASALVGLLFFAAYVPLTKSASARLANVEKTVKDVSDKRVSIITEVVQGIRAVKLFGWESCFVDKINKQRSIQLEKFWLAQKWQICVNALAALGPVLIPIVMFTVYVAILGNKLTAEIAFTSISVFQVVRFVFENGSELIGVAIRASVSLNRIESYLEQNAVQGLEDRVTLERSNTLGFEAADLEWAYQNVPSSNVPANSKHIDSGSAPDESTLLLATESSSHTDILPLLDQGLSTSPPPELQRSMRGFTLRDINVEFPTGGFSLVAGPTGSGKSSLLAALIGEMTLTRGRILLPTMHSRDMADEDIKYKDIIELSGDNGLVIRDIAYVAQEAWLRNATVRENILFDEPYNRERYEQVLHACALKPDLRVLLAGDQTEIGERGVTLSGGQKQRVALARAVYSSRSILLIDDCLSAVDAHTAKHILTECLANSAGLMQSRTRVLVTHHVSMCLPYAQYIVAMCEGRVVLKGVPADLQDHQGLALTAMSEHNRNVFNTIAKHDSKGRGKMTASATTAEENPLTQTAQLTADTRSEDEYNSGRMETIREQKEQALGDSVTAALQGTLVEEEKRETGSVRLKVWKMYFAACGSKSFWVWSLILLVSSRGMVLLHDYWIRIWVVSNDTNGGTIPRSVARHSVAYWLGIYVLIGLASVVWRVFLLRVMYRRAIKASMTIHSQLLKTMMRATPRFFNSTPIGRIINRFSRDMDVIDASVMNVLVAFASDILLVLITYAVILSAAPLFIFVVAFITLLFSWFGFYYANTCRELKRLEANSMSPLLSLFSELIQGVSTIRAFGVKHLYIKEANNRLCAHLQPLGITWLLYRWIGLRCDMTGSLVSFSCAMFVLYNMDWVDAGLAGFVLSYSLSFTSRMIWVVRNYTVNETNMNAVERVMQYMDTEQEASLESDPQNQPPPSWPRKGDVQIENLVAEYVPGVPVLHGISLSIKHGEKIGIVGRTGAGKSTMSLALLRFIEASKGRVVLDGVDISRIGLEDLRRNVTIIPQDPVLFNGSIRSNLDPLDEHPDELLWEALRRTHLIKENDSQNTYGSSSSSSISVTSVVEGGGFNSGNTSGDGSALERMAGIFTSLDAEIKENGQNLSLGQRQLVALARALVRRSKLIIMDEATASVDFDTDNRIQNTIRGPEFANSTLLCIAHRLRTIIDYDRVLVLDNGKVAELDTPYNLLQNKDGIFRSMCEKSGEREYLYSAAMSMSTTRCKTSIIN
ncbi:hypothetical protein EV177_001678 [Coemansia sp. RSA 1804]|nr:hypothetical protein EV177_001678 [Coemansia sp. RSA 1804]